MTFQKIETDSTHQEAPRVEVALEWLTGGESILDIGCNTGWFLDKCEHPKKIGLDLNEDFKDACEELGIEFHIGDATNLPFEDASFDRVHCGQVLAHLTEEDGYKVMDEIARVLKPDGLGVVTTKVGRNFRSALWLGLTGQFMRYTPPEYHLHEWEVMELIEQLRMRFGEVLFSIKGSSVVQNDHFTQLYKLKLPKCHQETRTHRL